MIARSRLGGRRSWLLFALAGLAVGIAGVLVTVERTDRVLRRELLERTHLIAQAVDAAQVLALSGSAEDLGSPGYVELKAKLTRVLSSMDGCRFLYIMGLRPSGAPDGGSAGEEVFFFVDSESPESGESSPPGQVFEDASEDLRDAFHTGSEFVEGPVTDRWGTWVSALVPLRDPASGAVIALVGVDVDAVDWKRRVFSAAAGSAAVTLAALALLILSIALASSRKRILVQQAALRESEERFREIVEQSRDVFYRQDIRTGRFEYVSPRIESLLGYTPEDLLSMGIEEQTAGIHSEDLPGIQGFVEQIVEADAMGLKTIEREFRLRHRNGEYRWIHGSYTLLRDGDGSPRRVIGSLQDITERRRMQEEHLALSVQLQQARRTEAIGRLAGGIAHDFNNLVMAINGYAELDRESLPPDHPVRRDLEEIMTAGRRAATLTRQLLTFARQQEIAPSSLDLNDAVEGLLQLLGGLLGTNIRLEWKPGEDLRPVLFDPGQFDQVLANLCLNARDAIHGVGRIGISTGRAAILRGDALSLAHGVSGEYTVLTVEDDGCGMDAETLEHIFDPFFTTKEPGEGTGLGLATVYGIVTQNHGFIDVDSEPGRGSVFRVHFPALPV